MVPVAFPPEWDRGDICEARRQDYFSILDVEVADLGGKASGLKCRKGARVRVDWLPLHVCLPQPCRLGRHGQWQCIAPSTGLTGTKMGACP